MKTWTPFTLAVVTNALPTDLAALYASWLTANPGKACRLAELVVEVRQAFRDAVAANTSNVVDTAIDTVPTIGFRHALNMVIYNLGMEMGAELAADADNMVTRAEIWLRMVENGGILIPTDADVAGGTPSYTRPVDREPRAARVLA